MKTLAKIPPVPKRLSAVEPSVTLALSAKAKEMAGSGIDVINLSAGEPDMPPPDFVLRALRDVDPMANTRYTNSRGAPPVRAAVADWIRREVSLDYAPEEVILLDGAKRALSLGIEAVFDDGDEVLLIAPCWLSYRPMLRLAGAVPVVLETRIEDGFRPNLEALEALVGPRTRGIILNSPQNPSGIVYTEAELDRLAAFIEAHDLLLISDEIYQHLQFGGVSVGSILASHPRLRERALMVNSLSKTYAVPGWRIGFAAGPSWWIDRMARAWGHSGSNLNALMQQVLVRVLPESTAFVDERRLAFARRAKLATEILSEIEGVRVMAPEGAFYILPDFGALMGQELDGRVVHSGFELAEILLDGALVAVVPGEAFDAPAHLRISLAVPDDVLRRGLERVDVFLRTKLKKRK
jgi:aspartate aminotransferase